MPGTAADARDLLIASVLSDDPVMYIDDRWSYDLESEVGDVVELNLAKIESKILQSGDDVTLVGVGHSTSLCVEAGKILKKDGISCEVIDTRVLNPNNFKVVIDSISRTGRLCVVDGGWTNCGMAGEIIARVVESIPPSKILASPQRVTLTDSPAPTSSVLEDIYYQSPNDIVSKVMEMVNR
jgi:pyruvate dehydrogenase E1 component beta subunit